MVVIFDVTNPEVPVIMGIYNDGRTQYRLDFADDYIFVTQQSYGFIILQLSERIIPGYGIPFIAIISLLCILFIYRGRRSRYVQR